MSQHLSGDQISAQLLGDYAPGVQQHLEACAVCRGEVARFESVLAKFRGSVTEWSETQRSARSRAVSRPRRSPLLKPVAAVGILLLLAFGLTHFSLWRDGGAAESDETLLNQVHRDLARSAPRELEPLQSLLSLEPGQ